jgi:hypothetical protein
MRLTMIGRAVPPEPAMAPSTHLLPVASNALASSATAAASPPDVHQCVTSRSVACAAPSGQSGRHQTNIHEFSSLTETLPEKLSSIDIAAQPSHVKIFFSTVVCYFCLQTTP